MKALTTKALRSRGVHLAMLALAAAAAVAGCRSAADAWQPRAVAWEQSEVRLARALEYAEAASDVEEIRIAGRDIWAIAADAALTAHPECASVVGSGRSGYPRAGMGVVEGLNNDSPLPANIHERYFPRLYGEPSRTYMDKRRNRAALAAAGRARAMLRRLRSSTFRNRTALPVEPEVEWRRTAEIRVAYCYDKDGEELANFDRAALPPLSSVNLADSSLSDEVHVRVRQPGEFLCASEVMADFSVEGLDENAPEYSGAAPGSEPTPAMWQALEDHRENPDDFEVWYVVGPRRGIVRVARRSGAGSDDRGTIRGPPLAWVQRGRGRALGRGNLGRPVSLRG